MCTWVQTGSQPPNFCCMVKIVLRTEYMSTNLLKSEIWLILVPKSNEIVLSTCVHEYKAQNLETWFHQTYLFKKGCAHGCMSTMSPKFKSWHQRQAAYMRTCVQSLKFIDLVCAHVRMYALHHCYSYLFFLDQVCTHVRMYPLYHYCNYLWV